MGHSRKRAGREEALSWIHNQGRLRVKKVSDDSPQVSNPLRQRRLTAFAIHKANAKLQCLFCLSHALTQALLLLFDSSCSSHSVQSYSTYEVNSAILVPFPTFFSCISSSASKETLFYLLIETEQNWNGRTLSLKMKYRYCMVQFSRQAVQS